MRDIGTIGAYLLALAVIVAATFLGAIGALDSEAVAALLGAVVTGPAAYALGRRTSNGVDDGRP